MEVKKRVGSALFVSAVLLAMLYVGGCIEAPTDKNTSGLTSADVCDNVFGLKPGGLYRVQANGQTLVKLAEGLNMPWEAYVDPVTGALYYTEDGTGNCTGSINRIADPNKTPWNIEVIVSNVDRPRRLVVAGDYLYFTEYKANGSVNRVYLPSSVRVKEQLISGLSLPFGLAVDDNDPFLIWVYFTEVGTGLDGTLQKFAINKLTGFTASSVTLAMGLQRPIGLTMDSFYAYVSEMEGDVVRMSKQASIDPPFSPEVEPLLSGLDTPYPPILESVSDGNNILYLADFSADDKTAGTIYKLSKVDRFPGKFGVDYSTFASLDCDGVVEVDCLALSGSLSWPMLVAQTSTQIFWSEIWSSSVKCVLKDGNPCPDLPLLDGVLTDEVVTETDMKNINSDLNHVFTPLGISAHEYPDGFGGFDSMVFFTDLAGNQCCF